MTQSTDENSEINTNGATVKRGDILSTAIGNKAEAFGNYTTAIGSKASVNGESSTGVGSEVTVRGNNSSAFGGKATVTANNATAIGQGTSVTANGGTAIGQGAKVTAENAIAIGQGSVANEANTVSVGNDGSNGQLVVTRRITNVAAGVKDTDAVNVGQLKSAVGNVENKVNRVDKGLRAGVAGAMASAGLYQVTQPGKSMLSTGAATYRGQSAVAVGYSRLSDSGRVGVKFSVNTNTQGDTGASVSMGYQW